MYDSKLVQMDSESSRIEDVWQQVKPLSTDEKAELVKRLLGKESGLVLVSTSTHLVDYIIAQMSLLSSEGLAYVQRAIAARIACEGSRSKR
jgi:hypothetical protein